MSLAGAIDSLSDGVVYTLTRTANGTTLLGRYTPGAQSTLQLTGNLQPVTSSAAAGRALQVLPEGQHGRELRFFWTETEVFTQSPTTEPDVIEIDGEGWEVLMVEKWAWDGPVHFKATLARQDLP